MGFLVSSSHDSLMAVERELRAFISNIDVNDPKWRSELEKFVLDMIAQCSQKRRVPTFSIGVSEEDEIVEEQKQELVDAEVQCELVKDNKEDDIVSPTVDGAMEDITKMWNSGAPVRPGDALRLLNRGVAKSRELEKRFDNKTSIAIRRAYVATGMLREVPYKHYDYKLVVDCCCENVIGYVPIPLGVAGPLRVNGATYQIPMATTEGALVASTNRGCSAIEKAGGVTARVYNEGMTRAPVVKFPSAAEAVEFKAWFDDEDNIDALRAEFESSSRFAKLKQVEVALAGDLAFVRFVALTGDAMGMNMVSKGSSLAMSFLKQEFPRMRLIALSGNYCVDKKASALNYAKGRGKSVIAECKLPASVVASVLKTTPKQMAEAAYAKLQIGSELAGCIGGSNAHAANIVAAIFLATGQDAAQVVSSSMCTTRMTVTDDGDLLVSCTMPCLEVGTVGGGTVLRPQSDCLSLLKCSGSNATNPGSNARQLAEIICSTVVAGELSLMAALVTDQLVSSHMRLNRCRYIELIANQTLLGAMIKEMNKNAEEEIYLEKLTNFQPTLISFDEPIALTL